MTNTPAPVDTDELANLMCALDVGGAKEDAALIEKTIDEIASLRAENKRLQVSIEHDSEITVESLHARTAAERAQREAESKLGALTLQNERLRETLAECLEYVEAIAATLRFTDEKKPAEIAERARNVLSLTPPEPSKIAEVVKAAQAWEAAEQQYETSKRDDLNTAGGDAEDRWHKVCLARDYAQRMLMQALAALESGGQDNG